MIFFDVVFNLLLFVFNGYKITENRPNSVVDQLLKTTLLAQEVFGSILGQVKSDTVLLTTHYRCDVSSELSCGDGPATFSTLRRITATIMKI